VPIPTETAVSKEGQLADTLRAVDSGDIALLTLLDLSAAFDTVDHVTLLRRLEVSYGISGTLHNWFTSHLSCRRQYVRSGSTRSMSTAILFGVPQGSVLNWSNPLPVVHGRPALTNHISMPMTHTSMVYIVLVTMNSYKVTCQRASMTLVHRCGRTGCSSTRRKRKYCGLRRFVGSTRFQTTCWRWVWTSFHQSVQSVILVSIWIRTYQNEHTSHGMCPAVARCCGVAFLLVCWTDCRLC